MTATAYGKATKGTGPELPELEDDNYRAMIKDVEDSVSKYNGQESPQYKVTFELLEVFKPNGDPVTLVGWIKIPDGVVNDGVLNENSKLYEFLVRGLGYDEEDLEIVPSKWQGEELRIKVENKEIKEGDNKGQVRPRIVGYLPKKGASRPAAQQRPAPAQAATRKTRSNDDDF